MKKAFALLFIPLLLTGDDLSYLNELRTKAGLIELQPDTLLEKAASNHARYLHVHSRADHFERSGERLYTGVNADERAHYVGYLGKISENIATSPNSRDAIDNLFSAIYHRYGFLDLEIDEIGSAHCCRGKADGLQVYVYDMANSRIAELCRGRPYNGFGMIYSGVCNIGSFTVKEEDYFAARKHNLALNPGIIVWPWDGAADIPAAFYEENPDPLPQCSVSGYPVSIEFNPHYFDHVSLVSFELYDDAHRPLRPAAILTQSSDPNRKLDPFQFAFMPEKRLSFDSRYTARVIYRVGDRTLVKEWSFRTRKPPYPILTAATKDQLLTVRSGKGYLLYLPPEDCRDTHRRISLSYIEGMKIDNEFLDGNTIYFKVTGKSGQMVRVKTDRGKKFRLKVR